VTDDEGKRGQASSRFGWGFSGFALLAVYLVLRIVVGFWWALGLTLAAALVLALLRFVRALTREATSPPPQRRRPRG
jgi:Na+-driven multidrug efflux pump